MINFDSIANENKIEQNVKWSYIPDDPYKALIIGSSNSGKTNTLLNSIHRQLDINKISLYAKDLYEAKYLFLINRREKLVLKHCDDLKAFIEYSNNMRGVHKNIEEHNPGKKHKVSIAFDDMIADMINSF